jgi:hypothetical protein
VDGVFPGAYAWKENNVGTIIALTTFGIAVGMLFLWGRREKRRYEENFKNRPRRAA